MNKLRLLLTALVVSSLGFLVNCSETTENADVFAAQKCLNDLTAAEESNTALLQACADKLGSASSSEAQTLRCSIALMQGGLTTNQIIESFKAEDDTANGQGGLILSLSYNGTVDQAVEAQELCDASGNQGLIGIAGFMVMGTAICGGVCPSNPNASTITSLLNSCASSCSAAQETAIANAAVSVADDYCGEEGDSESCQEINGVIDANTNADGSINASTLVDALMAAFND